ncbi:MAG: NAD(P)/FAD-dependent oxidoreductase [Candidatus Dormibacteraeota bacterium]|nr:NAD(P)/FAD-dependent oxidoreductase [Candidatus Dormibacteraeota bacterium]MBV9525063.1 NAD(P)/FAD-dependent oxidoreductase [Candidatus Dormibacteraeota bacterium]
MQASEEERDVAAREAQRVGALIVGTGFAGLGMAIRLKQAGIDDFVVLERADDVGGTWRDNSYPGCMCDVPSHLYSFSFAPKPDWTCTYPAQGEIWTYLRDCAEAFGVMPHIRFNSALREARWDADTSLWRVESERGSFLARFLVLGVGPLSDPKTPDLPGLKGFSGTVFHSARWRHDHDLRGERVAVVGTGASAIQFVPQIQPKVAHLDLFQRTPAWVLPHPNRDLTRAEQWLSRTLPAAQRVRRAGIYVGREWFILGFAYNPRLMTIAERAARKHLERQVPDPELRARLTPEYRIGCKRILISNDYYPSLTRPNVDVVTAGIREVRQRSVVDTDGVERAVDTIIFGTGFRVTDPPSAAAVRGASGASLADVWRGSPQAYLGTSIAGFPNMFFLAGPNTGLGHTSVVYMIESQINYVMDCFRAMRRSGAAVLDVKQSAQDAYNAAVQERMKSTVWSTGGCASWYIDANGRNSTLWPTFTFAFRRRAARFDPAAYTLAPAAGAAAAAA